MPHFNFPSAGKCWCNNTGLISDSFFCCVCPKPLFHKHFSVFHTRFIEYSPHLLAPWLFFLHLFQRKEILSLLIKKTQKRKNPCRTNKNHIIVKQENHKLSCLTCSHVYIMFSNVPRNYLYTPSRSHNEVFLSNQLSSIFYHLFLLNQLDWFFQKNSNANFPWKTKEEDLVQYLWL